MAELDGTQALIGGRVLWGGVLLFEAARPGALSSRPLVRAGAGLLGARHLVEGALLAGRRNPRPPRWAVAVDALHAASMVAVAVARPDLRRYAMRSAQIAGVLATLSAGER